MAARLTLMDKAALELGRVTVRWASLEDSINELIAEIAHLDEPDIRNTITGNADIRGKIQMAKGLAFLRKPTNDWFEAVAGTLDYIDNDIRVRRNNFIHARWVIPSGRLMRKTRRTKLLKPQAFKLELETEQVIPVKMAELRQMNSDMDRVWLDLFCMYYFIWRGNPWAKGEVKPPESFRQYLRQVGYGTRLRYERSKRKRQPKSSQA